MRIDVCQNDGNLLVAAGSEKHIKIYDRRESQIVRTFEEVHSGKKHAYYLPLRIIYYSFLHSLLVFIFLIDVKTIIRNDKLRAMEFNWRYAL